MILGRLEFTLLVLMNQMFHWVPGRYMRQTLCRESEIFVHLIYECQVDCVSSHSGDLTFATCTNQFIERGAHIYPVFCVPRAMSLQRQSSLRQKGWETMFKVEVINALQTRFGPSQYTSLKTTLQSATQNCKMNTSL